MGANLLIEVLTQEHNIKGFICSKPTLTKYAHDFAFRNTRDGFSKAYVLREADSVDVIGFYTLSNSGIPRESISGARGMPVIVPTILLGRMAVHQDHERKGYGTLLLIHAMREAVEADEKISAWCLEVHALDEDMKGFYTQYGFKEFLDHPLHLYKVMATIRQELIEGFGTTFPDLRASRP